MLELPLLTMWVCVCVCVMSCGTEGYGMLEFPLLHGLCVCLCDEL